jgi:hypothetical protein
MITRPSPPPDLLYYSFLRNELSKRWRPTVPPQKEIAMVEEQTRAPTRGPHYLRANSAQYTFNELPPDFSPEPDDGPEPPAPPPDEGPRRLRSS